MCAESWRKALVRIWMAASLWESLMLSWQIQHLLHCFYVSPVIKDDWDTTVLGTLEVQSSKHLSLTAIDSLNKWYYVLEVTRFVCGCSSSLIVPASLPTSRFLSCVSWQSACLRSSSNKCSHSLTIYLWLCGIPNRPSERELFLP